MLLARLLNPKRPAPPAPSRAAEAEPEVTFLGGTGSADPVVAAHRPGDLGGTVRPVAFDLGHVPRPAGFDVGQLLDARARRAN